MITTNKPNSEEEKIILNLSRYDSRPKIRLRAQILLAAWQEMRPQIIAQTLHCDLKTVYKWIHRWNSAGVRRVNQWQQMNYREAGKKRSQAIQHLLSHSPGRLGLPFSVWTISLISAFFTDLVEYPLSRTTIWRDLKSAHYSYRKVQEKLIWKDPLYDVKKAQLILLQRFCPDSFRLVFVDEKGPIHAKRQRGQRWSINPLYQEVRQSSNGKIKFLGAYDPLKDLIYMEPMNDGTSQSFCEALSNLALHLQDQPWRKLVIVLDNASIHHSQFTSNYWAGDPRVELFYLPTYSPELNPIETRFSRYCAECLNHSWHQTVIELINATLTWCTYYNTLRKEIYGKGGMTAA